jgi:5-methylcytosine-specific restriction endonuclease McrA
MGRSEGQKRRYMSAIVNTPHVCTYCKSVFHPKRSDRVKFCSRSCAFATSKQNAERSEEIKAFVASEVRIYRMWAKRARSAVRTNQRLASKAALDSFCRTCGKHTPYAGDGRPRIFCSSECRPISEADKRVRRTAKARRRAIERGIKADRFDPLSVLERDGWRCHLCGRLTPRRLRGSFDDRAPELDHIIPLSAGGQHILTNVACACRACNLAKGGLPKGQMRLLA